MSKMVAIDLEDISRLRLPPAVYARLQELLDRQDRGLKLRAHEREEAEGLVEVAEMLSLLKLRAERAEAALALSK